MWYELFYLRQCYKTMGILDKYFSNFNFLKQDQLETMINELLEDVNKGELEHVEREIRFPAESIRDHYMFDSFDFNKSNPNIVNTMNYLKSLLKGVRETTIQISYTESTKKYITSLIRKFEKTDAPPEFSIKFQYIVPIVGESISTNTNLDYMLSETIKIHTKNIPGWMVELTDLNDVITIPYFSRYLLNRGESKKFNYRITHIDNRIYVKDFKTNVFTKSFESIKISKNIEQMTTKPTKLEIKEGLTFLNGKFRRVINRYVFGIPSENGLLVAYLGKILTTEDSRTPPLNVSLEFELFGYTKYEESYINIIYKCLTLYRDTLLMPDVIYTYMKDLFKFYSSTRQKPVDLDGENSYTLVNNAVNAYLTNKLDGVGKLLVVHARHIYLLWEENNVLKYNVIGYSKTLPEKYDTRYGKYGVLGSSLYVIEVETYGKYYIGCYNFLAIDSRIDLKPIFISINDTMKSKLAYLEIYLKGIKLSIDPRYTVEVKKHVLIRDPRNVQHYLDAIQEIDESVDKNMLNDGYIITINNPIRGKGLYAVYKLKNYHDYTVDHAAINPLFLETEKDRILTLILNIIGFSTRISPEGKPKSPFQLFMNDRELIRHITESMKNLVISKNITTSDKRLFYRFDKIRGNASRVVGFLNNLKEVRMEDDSFKYYLTKFIHADRHPMVLYHGVVKEKLVLNAYKAASADIRSDPTQQFIIDIGSGRGGDLIKLLARNVNNYIFIEPDLDRFGVLYERIIKRKEYIKRPGSVERLSEEFYEFTFKKNIKIYIIRGFPIQIQNIVISNSVSSTFDQDMGTLVGQLLKFISMKNNYSNPTVKFVSMMSVITLVDSFPPSESDQDRPETEPHNNPVNQLVSDPKHYGRIFNLIYKDIVDLTNNHCFFAVFGIDSHRLFTRNRGSLATKVGEDSESIQITKVSNMVATIKITNVGEDPFEYDENIVNMKQILRNLNFQFNLESYHHCSEVFNTSDAEYLRFSQAHFSMILKGYKY